MPRIRTRELIEKIENGNYKSVTLRALGGGREVFLLIEDEKGIFVHENLDGTIKIYPKVHYALDWLKMLMDVEMVVMDKNTY